MRAIGWLFSRARAALEQRLLGITAEEIRYTFADVRGEIRANRAELLQEIARLRDQIYVNPARPDPVEGPLDSGAAHLRSG